MDFTEMHKTPQEKKRINSRNFAMTTTHTLVTAETFPNEHFHSNTVLFCAGACGQQVQHEIDYSLMEKKFVCSACTCQSQDHYDIALCCSVLQQFGTVLSTNIFNCSTKGCLTSMETKLGCIDSIESKIETSCDGRLLTNLTITHWPPLSTRHIRLFCERPEKPSVTTNPSSNMGIWFCTGDILAQTPRLIDGLCTQLTNYFKKQVECVKCSSNNKNRARLAILDQFKGWSKNGRSPPPDLITALAPNSEKLARYLQEKKNDTEILQLFKYMPPNLLEKSGSKRKREDSCGPQEDD